MLVPTHCSDYCECVCEKKGETRRTESDHSDLMHANIYRTWHFPDPIAVLTVVQVAPVLVRGSQGGPSSHDLRDSTRVGKCITILLGLRYTS